MVFITIGLHFYMLPSWHFFQYEPASDCFFSPGTDSYLLLFSLLEYLLYPHFFIKSKQPLIKALMPTETHTGYYCTHRPQTTRHWGPNSSSVRGEVKVSDRNCFLSTSSYLRHMSRHRSCVQGKHIQGKLVCDLIETCLNSAAIGLSFALFFLLTLCNPLRTAEGDPARKMS